MAQILTNTQIFKQWEQIEMLSFRDKKNQYDLLISFQVKNFPHSQLFSSEMHVKTHLQPLDTIIQVQKNPLFQL